MDWSLIVFLVVILFFGYRGYRRGLLKSVARILSVVAGYSCAILYTGETAKIIESQFQLQGIAAFLVASVLLFFGAGFLVSLLFWLLQKFLMEDDSVSTASAIGGGVVGLATGTLLAIIIVWAVSFVRDSRPAEAVSADTTANPGRVEELANRVAGKAVESAMSLGSASPEVKKITAAVVAAPGEMVQRAQRLAQSEDMVTLLNDPRNQAVLDSGDYEAVRSLPAFQQLINNDDLQALASATGLLDDAARNNQPLDVAMATQLTDIWGRTQRVKNDPRVQQIIGDAEFQQNIRSGNPLDLLANEKLLELADIIFADEAGAVKASSGITAADQAGNAQPKQSGGAKKVYSWTDEKGQLHISDVDPDSRD